MTDIKHKTPPTKENERARDQERDQKRVPPATSDDKSNPGKKPDSDTVARDEEQDDRFQATDN